MSVIETGQRCGCYSHWLSDIYCWSWPRLVLCFLYLIYSMRGSFCWCMDFWREFLVWRHQYPRACKSRLL